MIFRRSQAPTSYMQLSITDHPTLEVEIWCDLTHMFTFGPDALW